MTSGTFQARRRDEGLRRVRFENPVTARYFRLVSLSDVNGGEFANVCEISILTDSEP